MGKLVLKINVRHSDTGNKIRTITRFTNFTMNRVFNSFASTFSFDFYFDPRDKELAEIVCVSHMHECSIYYNNRLELTGYILSQTFDDPGKPELVTISGYAKPGVLNDCDVPFSLYPLETDGLTFRQIIQKIIPPFHIGLVIDPKAAGSNVAFKSVTSKGKEVEDKLDEDVGKTASESSQNVASYLSELAKQRNIVISHNGQGNLHITTPNTAGRPIMNFDFTQNENGELANTDLSNAVKKIPGTKASLVFNGQLLHTDITVVQQADDEEGTNAAQGYIRNPLIPIKASVLYRPRVVIISSGDQFTVDEVARYELGREIRDAVILKISMSKIDIDELMIQPNNTITVKDPSVFLYNKSTWFIQSIDFDIQPSSETCVLNCVLPFAYDFKEANLKNVFVDVHANLPRF